MTQRPANPGPAAPMASTPNASSSQTAVADPVPASDASQPPAPVRGSDSAPSDASLKVCILGNNASLKFGGEGVICWYFFKYLRERGVDAHLVVHGRTRLELLDGFPADQDRIHTIPDSPLDRYLHRLGWRLGGKIDAQTLGILRHYLTQLRQRRVIRELIRQGKVNLLHEVVPIAPKQISAMYGLGIPVVMGPLSGGMTFPPAFSFMESRAARIVERVGRAMSHLLQLLIPGRRRAQALIIANEQTRKALPWGTRGTLYYMPETGVDLHVWDGGRTPMNDNQIRFVYLGRLSDWKGVTFLVEAFALVAPKAPGAHLHIIGDGEERAALEAQTDRLHLRDRITFHGYLLPHQSAPLLRQADAMVLPSLHESGGIVVLEAMAIGIPVIATQWGGPAVHVTDDTGIRVAPTTRQAFVQGLADAMLRVAASPDLRQRMGDAGRRRIKEACYDWGGRIDRVLQIYAQTRAAGKSESR